MQFDFDEVSRLNLFLVKPSLTMSTAATTPLSYEPRRSNVAANDVTQADGDTWQEKLAVCETSKSDGNPKLLIRSYYRNNRTSERVWDEPPSGASQVNYATPEMRRMAQTQMDELQLTLEMIPPDIDEAGDAHDKNKKGKMGLRRMFSRKKERKYVEPSKDLNLQRAIVRSMAEQRGSSDRAGRSSPRIYYETGSVEDEDDPDMALAKALSMSEYNSESIAAQNPSAGLTEEEMLEKAIAASKLQYD